MDKLIGLIMLLTGAFIFSYYTIWTLVTVCVIFSIRVSISDESCSHSYQNRFNLTFLLDIMQSWSLRFYYCLDSLRLLVLLEWSLSKRAGKLRGRLAKSFKSSSNYNSNSKIQKIQKNLFQNPSDTIQFRRLLVRKRLKEYWRSTTIRSEFWMKNHLCILRFTSTCHIGYEWMLYTREDIVNSLDFSYFLQFERERVHIGWV